MGTVKSGRPEAAVFSGDMGWKSFLEQAFPRRKGRQLAMTVMMSAVWFQRMRSA